MSSTTAFLYIGDEHPFHGGINPTHILSLTENDRPALILQSLENPDIDTIVWTPTLENTLEDCVLLFALHVTQLPRIVELAAMSITSHDTNWIEMYEHTTAQGRQEMYRVCQEAEWHCKIVITALAGSLLLGQLDRMNDYQLKFEICVSQLVS